MTNQIKIPILLLIFIIRFSSYSHAQYLKNPSLEGSIGGSGQPVDWQREADHDWSDPDLFTIYSPMGLAKVYSPVDGEIFTLYRSRGTTYAESWHAPRQREYSYQELIKPLEAWSCFKFKASLAFNSFHEVQDSDPELVDKAFPLTLQLWGGHGPYDRQKLLFESDPVDNEDWEEYTFYFSTADEQFEWILFEVQWDTINIRPEPYNGMMLIDNLALERVGDMSDLEVDIDTIYYKGDGLTSLIATEGLSYKWFPSEWLTDPNIQNPVITGFQDSFKVVIEETDACPVTEKFIIILNCDTMYPGAYFHQRDVYYKYEKNIHLEASPGNTYSWEPQINLSAYDVQSPYMTAYNESYVVTVFDKYGCTFQERYFIRLVCDTLFPEKTIMVLDSIIPGDSEFKLSAKYGWPVASWSPNKFLSCNDCDEPVATPEVTTTYSVELEDNFGCIHEELFRLEILLEVPDVITPNMDGFNDCFRVFGLPSYSFLYIYTKTGQLVKSFNSYTGEQCWRGEDKNGYPLETGTYWYVIGHEEYGTLKTGYVFIKR
ncbi:MAG: gliding motility-associated C-terminal domain-containing protein [Bacteroidales bacterium]|nr:gliding motility-associated C-terminal domain-containing protein [Bacteroidales bacterium]MBN2820092.1 gliding motility-associated C-terminal domain-containing protein [Bacteroidales bacterium]